MSQRRTDPKRGPGVLFLLLTGFGLFYFSDTLADPDLWGHVRFGQDILRARSVPRADPYSYRTEGQPWVNHEWLAEVVFAGLYETAGPTGLILFKTLAGVAILNASYLHVRRAGLSLTAAAVLLALLLVPLRMGLGTVRPQLFTYVLFLVLLLLIAKATPGREYRLWPAPAILAVWVNVHGGVLAGLGVLTLWGFVRLARWTALGASPPDGRARGIVSVILILAVGCAALGLNPYGFNLPLFLLRTATVPRPEILEWKPLGILSLPGLAYVALLAAVAFGLARGRRPVDPGDLLILAVTTLLPAVSARHFPLFALAAVVLAPGRIADALDRSWPPKTDRPALGSRARALSAAAAVLFALLALPRFACLRLDPGQFSFPARAVMILKQANVAGNLALPFAWGEYVLWHLGPRVKVSIDGRRETLYSDRVYQQSRDFELGSGAWEAVLNESPTDMVLTPQGTPTANLMDCKTGWRHVYADRLSRLYVRDGSPLAATIMSRPVPAIPDDGAGLCFPRSDRARRRPGR